MDQDGGTQTPLMDSNRTVLAGCQRASAWLSGAYMRLPWVVRHGLVVAVAFLLLVRRRPEMLTRAEFFNEDGQVFYLGAYFGSPVDSIVRSYQGYLHVLARLLALVERTVPIAYAPFVGNAASLLLVAAVAGYLASGRMADLIPSQLGRWLVALLVIVVPGSFESLGSVTYVQWYLAVYLIVASMARLPASRLEGAGDVATLTIASLTGPFGILAAPLYVIRLALERSHAAAWRCLAVVIPALVQGTVLVTSPRAAAVSWSNLTDVVSVFGLRGVIVPLLGSQQVSSLTSNGVAPTIAVAGAFAAVAALVVLACGLPNRRLTLVIGYGYVVMLAAGLKGSTDAVESFYSVWSAQRYFLIPGIMIAVLIGSALASLGSWRRLLAAALMLVLGIGIVNDYLLPPRPYLDWSVTSSCIGGPAPCVVPVMPPAVWSIRWPGLGGDYEQTHLPP